jgi:ribonucleoside-diphosphate reductase alpha chain
MPNGHGRKNGNGSSVKKGNGRRPTATIVQVQEGLHVPRLFTTPNLHPYDEIEWERRKASIVSYTGKVSFEQDDVEFPSSWSLNATNIVAEKYFRGKLGTPTREWSVKQIIDRVVDSIGAWGTEQGRFSTDDDRESFVAELKHILVTQKASFNSPVWFNIGVKGRAQQASACFILHVDDSIESIADWYRDEMFIFQGGSGSGLNVSNLRSSYEHISPGGFSSGPVTFMRGADASAGTIKSGGATRRAAKMVVFDVNHPDLLELKDGSPGFVWCKAVEERKARALKVAGFDMAVDSGIDAYSIQYQNANNSVRVTDEFMQAYLEGRDWHLRAVTTGDVMKTYESRDIMKQISQAAWECADPGMQYHSTVNDWHTAPAAGPITASNPCSEYMHIDNSPCNLASINLLKFLRTDGTFDTAAFEHAVFIVLLAQAILCVAADYPTEKIGENARGFRQLGIGYANLGALLMALGAPYDSDIGRAWAAAITSLMQGAAYRASARFAEIVGPYPGTDDLPGFAHPENRNATLRVLRKHAAYSRTIAKRPADEDRKLDKRLDVFHDEVVGGGNPAATDDGLAHVVDRANTVWDETLELAERFGVENSQVSVLAPTGCLVEGTLVPTERGLVRLGSLGDPLGDKWQDIDLDVMTDEGPRRASKFFVNGFSPVVNVSTSRGYTVKGTPEHRIKVVDGDKNWTWKRFADLRPGDLVPLAMDQLVGRPQHVPLPPLPDAYWTSDHTTRVPREMTADLAEFIGYFMGDGSLHSKGIRLCVAGGDFDVLEHLRLLGKILFGLEAHVDEKPGYTEVAFHSVRLTLWWEACGLAKKLPDEGHSGKGYHPHIPDAVLYSNDREVYAAFLRGLFEADGTVTGGYPSVTTASFDFYPELQTVMLALGYPTTLRINTSGWGNAPTACLRLMNSSYNTRWLDEVGFIGSRKNGKVLSSENRQAARLDRIPMTREMVDRLAPKNDRLRRVLLLETGRDGAVSRRAATQLYERTRDAELEHALRFFYDGVSSADLGEEELTFDLSVPDNVTYVANGFVSHNTIGFMMDCDTTGIEPDLALKKVKKMVGGGTMQIVNQTLPRALRRLGYEEEQVEAIVAYVDENNTVVGAPALRPEHYDVFACSFTTDNLIGHMGHLKMMAAAQPFLSGAISKTVNVPEQAGVEDMEEIFVEGWRLGLKAVAMYRDNCKADQPLSATQKKTVDDTVGETPAQAPRKRLPRIRNSVTYSFRVADTEGYVHVGLYPDSGQPGEMFIKVAKQGSTLAGVMGAFALSVSMGLQHGVPLETFVQKFVNDTFEPHGITDDPDIRFAKSLMDYIFRRLALDFLPKATREALGIRSVQEREELLNGDANGVNIHVESATQEEAARPEVGSTADLVPALDAPFCSNCGTRMRPAGSCFACESCGATSGCS